MEAFIDKQCTARHIDVTLIIVRRNRVAVAVKHKYCEICYLVLKI